MVDFGSDSGGIILVVDFCFGYVRFFVVVEFWQWWIYVLVVVDF